MKSLLVLGLLAVMTLCGCSDGTTDAAGWAPTTTTSAPASTAPSTTSPTVETPPPAAVTPTAGENRVAPAPLENAPAAQIENPITPDSGGGVPRPTGEELYEQTCQQFIAAIDALEKSGVSDRQRSLDGIETNMRDSDEWKTVPPEDQQEILRGLDAAGGGRC